MSGSARIIAGVAIAGLLGSGCSGLVNRPSTASAIADATLGATALLVVNNQWCERTGPAGRCYTSGMAMVMFGGPLLVVGLMSGVAALGGDAAEDDRPALEAHVDPAVSAPLPEIPTDPVTLQLARQTRAAAVNGQCVAARAAMDEIAARDADYHIAMLVKGVLGACR